jgi:hypothetical protein
MARNHRRALAAAVLLGAIGVSGGAPAAPVFSNGGGQYWVAFDPTGRDLGPVHFMSKRIVVLNTSNQPNDVSVFYEPAHTSICATTLAPGAVGTCGVVSSPATVGGYFQVIAAHPVLAGGSSDTAYMDFAQQNAQGQFGADPAHGAVISVPLSFQPGCPPRPGNGCPDGRIAIDPNGGAVGGLQQFK